MQLGAQAVGANLFPFPDGKADTIDALVAELEVFAKSPDVTPTSPAGQAGQDYFTKRALELVKSFGYTTVNEGRMMGPQAKDIESLATRGLLDIDVIGFAIISIPASSPPGGPAIARGCAWVQMAWATGGLAPAPGNDDGPPAPCAPEDVHLAGGRHQAPSASMSAKA